MIDLFSDTKTRPTPAMRAAMAGAEVGDESSFEDPTVNLLCERVADLLGKEAALFTPSGTMCNQIALAVHGRPGDEVICDASAHIVHSEAGGVAANGGLNLCTVPGLRGRYSAAQLRAAIRTPARGSPRQRVVVVEQTSNFGGGAVWPVAELDAVTSVAHEHGYATHMDGARLMNAVVASGVSASAQARGFDSVWIDFSKGLGAPVGAALAGSKAFIAEAWRVKQRFGGSMRQAGIVAAGALYALDHHVERLAEDHANARALAQGLVGIPGLRVDPTLVDTNILFLHLDDAPGVPDGAEFCRRIQEHGVRMWCYAERTVRAVTHLDVGAADIGVAVGVVRQAMQA